MNAGGEIAHGECNRESRGHGFSRALQNSFQVSAAVSKEPQSPDKQLSDKQLEADFREYDVI